MLKRKPCEKLSSGEGKEYDVIAWKQKQLALFFYSDHIWHWNYLHVRGERHLVTGSKGIGNRQVLRYRNGKV